VSGGTDNHLMLVDLRPFDEELTGQGGPPRARPGRHQPQQEHGARRPAPARSSPRACASARPAVTTQGMGAREMREIAFQIHRVLTHRDDDNP
jgi:glycine hydroxymethyltransferase